MTDDWDECGPCGHDRDAHHRGACAGTWVGDDCPCTGFEEPS